MKLIDTHAHLNLEEYNNDRRQVIENSLNEGVFMINVGVNYASSLRAVEISQEAAEGIWAAVGLHPQNIDDDLHPEAKDFRRPEDIREPEFNAESYRQLVKSTSKVVAVGEIGLDYSRLPSDEIKASAIRLKQQEIFKKQLEFAKELGLPVIIHSRTAHKDVLRILKGFAGPQGRIDGVVHCFSGNAKEAAQLYDLGLYFGLNGIIFKTDINEAIAGMPLDRILLETDCPFLSPLPEVKRNEPRFVANVAERVAQIRNDSVETIIEAATANARKLFKI